ncbi:MAG TPA: cupin-like domain-containing protein [Blastocatellia bacterium]|jgi:lysine-specific demethylase 8|nr:cupin-like domain-containing protein [Blastocatellia bacterium]
MSRSEIERIAAPSREVFLRDYVNQQRPVVITNLFEGQPLRDISTAEDAKARLGDMKLQVSDEYVSAFLKRINEVSGDKGTRHLPDEKEIMTLKEYLEWGERDSDAKKIATGVDQPQLSANRTLDYSTAPELMAMCQLPDYCKKTSEYSDLVTQIFAANAGNFAHLHFDGDQRQLFLYEVFGTKRFILIPPRSAKKLNPVGGQSTFFLENMSEAEKQKFIEYTEGRECVLQPGETLFVPSLSWHYVEYLDAALSLSMRFGRNKYTHFLATKMHVDMYVQNVSAKMVDEAVVERQYLDVFREIEDAYYKSYESKMEKYKRMNELFQDIYSRICTDAVQGLYSFTNFESLLHSLVLFKLDTTPLYDLNENRLYETAR